VIRSNALIITEAPYKLFSYVLN